MTAEWWQLKYFFLVHPRNLGKMSSPFWRTSLSKGVGEKPSTSFKRDASTSLMKFFRMVREQLQTLGNHETQTVCNKNSAFWSFESHFFSCSYCKIHWTLVFFEETALRIKCWWLGCFLKKAEGTGGSFYNKLSMPACHKEVQEVKGL